MPNSRILIGLLLKNCYTLLLLQIWYLFPYSDEASGSRAGKPEFDSWLCLQRRLRVSWGPTADSRAFIPPPGDHPWPLVSRSTHRQSGTVSLNDAVNCYVCGASAVNEILLKWYRQHNEVLAEKRVAATYIGLFLHRLVSTSACVYIGFFLHLLVSTSAYLYIGLFLHRLVSTPTHTRLRVMLVNYFIN